MNEEETTDFFRQITFPQRERIERIASLTMTQT